jgi:hypothetical protein
MGTAIGITRITRQGCTKTGGDGADIRSLASNMEAKLPLNGKKEFFPFLIFLNSANFIGNLTKD